MKELNWIYNYTDVGKDQNQYTSEECHRIGPVDAKYVKSSNPDFNRNPFIEALPRPRDGNDILKGYMIPIPKQSQDELNKMSSNEQKATVLSLKKLRLPLAFQKQLEFINYDVMASSYMLRKSYVWDNESFSETVGEQSVDLLVKMKGKIEDSAPTGFSLLGFSGCGKSSSLKQLFDNIPQLIIHHPDPGTRVPQITYLVVSCMPNSNFSSLYAQIGEAIDNALGNSMPIYETMIRKKCRSLADKQLKVCDLIEKFSIGTIVLDEIQLIDFNSNKENSYEGLLGIVNKTKIALSVVGTDEAYKKLFSLLRNARRSGDYIDASNYTSDKAYFDYLTKLLFTWQWTEYHLEWTPEIGDTLYKCTGGIINQLIWLYKWMMLEYIDSKSKGKPVIIDCKFIESIFNKHFKHLKTPIDFINQMKIEESEDDKILALAKAENDPYKMPEVQMDDMIYETNMISKVIRLIQSLYPNYDSDQIGTSARSIMAEDEAHQLKANQIAQGVLNILQNKPKKKTRTSKKDKPVSKNICDYL